MPKKLDQTTFEASYKVLNNAQKEAVDTIEGPVMVIAGPGTGKTTILTLRIANILRKTDTEADCILALTFTESGAFAMRKKLADTIGADAYKVNIHTFHGFSETVIQEYPDYFPRIIGSAIVSDADQIQIIEKILQSDEIDLLRPYGDPMYYVRPILHEIHMLKRENVSPAVFARSVIVDAKAIAAEPDISATDLEKANKRNQKNAELALVYEKYEEALAKHKYYDFDDMLLELIKAMEDNAEFKLILQEKYQYILADEHQDANASQNRILELLSDFHDSPNLFIVGDDKQAIYRFQGASLENFMYFTKKYRSAKVITLLHNYRSHQLILDAAHSVIVRNPSIEGKGPAELRALQVGGRPVKIAEFADKVSELEYVASEIRKLIDTEKEKPEEIAVFFRENGHAREVAAALKRLGIPCRNESDQDVLSGVDATKVLILLRAIADPADDASLGKALLLKELGCDPADVSAIFKISRDEGLPLHSVIKERSKKKSAHPVSGSAPRSPSPVLRAPGSKLQASGSSLYSGSRLQAPSSQSSSGSQLQAPSSFTTGIDWKTIGDAYNRIAAWSQDSEIEPFQDFLYRLLTEMGVIVTVVKSGSLERMNALLHFYEMAIAVARSKKTFFLKDFIEYIDVIADHGISSKRPNTEHIEGVRLMTAHRSKGLEFNYVFIIHAVDGVWGNRRSRNLFTVPIIEHARDTGRIEDERRLFYVAMTRAREGITITYAKADADKQTLKSQFIDEVDSSLVSFEQSEQDPKIVSPFPREDLSMPSGLVRDQSGSFAGMNKLNANSAVGQHPEKAKKDGATDVRRPGNATPILDPNYVRSIFLAQPLSVTHLNNYIECPWRYFFQNLIRLPQAHSKSEMYGTAIHLTLKAFFNAYKEDRIMSKKQVIELFNHNLEAQTMGKADREDSLEKGKRALGGYLDEYGNNWNKNLFTEYSIRGSLVLEGGGRTEKEKLKTEKLKTESAKAAGRGHDESPIASNSDRDQMAESEGPIRIELTGKLDKIELLNDKEVTVVDYKTGKPKSRNDIEGKTKDSNGNYKRQLTFYKLLLDGDKHFRMKYGEIDFIEPNDRGIHKKERFEIADFEVEDLKKVIAKAAREIMALDFLNRQCAEKDCEFCKLGKVLKD